MFKHSYKIFDVQIQIIIRLVVSLKYLFISFLSQNKSDDKINIDFKIYFYQELSVNDSIPVVNFVRNNI